MAGVISSTINIGGKDYPAGSWEAWNAGQLEDARRRGVATETEAAGADKYARGVVEKKRQTEENQTTFENTRQTTGDTQRSRILDALLAAMHENNTSSSTGNQFTGGGTPPPPIQYHPSSLGGLASAAGEPAQVNQITPVDTTEARRAAFAHAKDQVGETSAGALTGLRSALGGRGMLGSGAESQGTMNIVGKGQSELGDVSRAQAINDAKLAQETATTNYKGGIEQRGQDITSQDIRNTLASEESRAGYAGEVTQRGQDILGQSSRNSLAVEQAQNQATRRANSISGLAAALAAWR